MVEHLAHVGYVPPSLDFARRIEAFATTLALWGSKLNLTSAPDDPQEIAFHIIDSLTPMILAVEVTAHGTSGVLARVFVSGMRVLDLGSGAGFPALILAAACADEMTPDFTLLEARRKRTSFLSVAAAEMGLANIRVNSSRADSMPSEALYDVVTARAFAHPTVVYRTAAAALKPGGRAILYASPAQRSVIEQAAGAEFEPPVVIDYQVPRAAIHVVHLLVVSRRR